MRNWKYGAVFLLLMFAAQVSMAQLLSSEDRVGFAIMEIANTGAVADNYVTKSGQTLVLTSATTVVVGDSVLRGADARAQLSSGVMVKVAKGEKTSTNTTRVESLEIVPQ